MANDIPAIAEVAETSNEELSSTGTENDSIPEVSSELQSDFIAPPRNDIKPLKRGDKAKSEEIEPFLDHNGKGLNGIAKIDPEASDASWTGVKIVGEYSSCQKGLRKFYKSGGFKNVKGMNVLITAMFIVGETAGGGLVALPSALANAGLMLGAFFIIAGAFICSLTGDMLSENWSIMMLRWPEYRHHTGRPYPEMGRRACSRGVAHVVGLILNLTQFGTAVVFLLLGSKNISSFVQFLSGYNISFCIVIVVVSFFVFPLTLLRSPKDFWGAVIFAMCTTSAAVVLIMLGAYLDYPHCKPIAEMPAFDIYKVAQTFGTVMFAYGGHGAFPTIQHDMLEPHKFSRSVRIAFSSIGSMYLPVSVFGAIVYGNSLHDVIIPSIQNSMIQQIVNLLITAHVFLALSIVFNPINQDLEDIFNVPEEFSTKRVMVRGTVLIAVVACALSVPTFGPLLDLVGGSTITLMAVVLPAYFNLHLSGKLNKFGVDVQPVEPFSLKDCYMYNTYTKFFRNVIVIIIGVAGGIAASYSAITSLMTTSFAEPCYLPFIKYSVFGMDRPADVVLSLHIDNFGIPLTEKFACCGPYMNVSALGPAYCLDASSIVGGSHG